VKRKRQRNDDGTFGRANAPSRTTDRTSIARWAEDEVVQRKIGGGSFSNIADAVSKAGRGEIASRIPRPEGVKFPADYSISGRAAAKAFGRRNTREPSQTPEELRALIYLRLENILLVLQPGLQRGQPRSVARGITVLDRMAKIAGLYDFHETVELEDTLYLEHPSPSREYELKLYQAMTLEERETVAKARKSAHQRLKKT
jgi:hypothetical protein